MFLYAGFRYLIIRETTALPKLEVPYSGMTFVLSRACGYNNQMQIIRTRRKTLALVVLPGGDLLVRAPLHLPMTRIEAFVHQHSAWVEKARARAASQPDLPGSQGFIEGELFPYLGQQYPLRLTSALRPALAFTGGEFCLAASAQLRAAALFQRWYRAQAQAELRQRVEALALPHGLQYSKVRISSARTHWGSCSAKGTLSFTWRLLQAPPEIIEYVIIHELCHLREHNHSAQFWALVGTRLPDFAVRRKWLKENGARLGIAGL